MSVRMKLSHSKTASRRAHHKLCAPRLVSTETGVRRRHFVDTDTGMYRGKQIIIVGKPEVQKTAKKTKAATKKTEKKEVVAKKASPESK